MNALPARILLVPHARFLGADALRLAISAKHGSLRPPSIAHAVTYRSMNCRRRTYAMHADSSPSMCTTGVSIVQLIVGLLALAERTKRERETRGRYAKPPKEQRTKV